MSDEEQEFKIDHRTSKTFASTFSNGVTLTLAPSGYYQLTFWEEVVGIVQETAKPKKDGGRDIYYKEEDTFLHKEDKMRVTMDLSTLSALHKVISRRLEMLQSGESE